MPSAEKTLDLSALFHDMNKAAITQLESYRLNNVNLLPGSTICVALSETKHIYTIVSSVYQYNGQPMPSHAERDTLAVMQRNNDPVMSYMILMDATTRQYIIPCSNCASYIIASHPGNENCKLLLPDKIMALAEICQATMQNSPMSVYATADPAANPPVIGMLRGNGAPMSRSMTSMMSFADQTQNANANLLKDKLNSLKHDLNDTSDNDDTEQTTAPKKKFFGLF